MKLDSSSMKGREVSTLDDISLNGSRTGTSDADKLLMIAERFYRSSLVG